MAVSVGQVIAGLFLAWLVRHLYNFYSVYKKLPSPTHVTLVHYWLGVGALLPPFGHWKRFSINLGPANWTATYKNAAVGVDRLNAEHDYFAFISVFPVIAAIIVYDGEAIKEMHTDRSRFDRPPAMRDVLALYGSNVLTTIGKQHKRHRSIAQPSFNDKSNRLVWRATSEVMRQMFDQHDREFPGQDVVFSKVHDQTARVALVVISTAGFGLDMSWQDSAHKEDIASDGSSMSLNTALRVMTTGNNILFRMALPKLAYWLPFKTLKNIDRGFKQFETSMLELIDRRLELQQKGEQSDDILEALVSSASQPDGFSRTETLANCFIMLLAGHETSANCLAATLALLSLNPSEQEKLHAHVQSVTDDGLHLEFEDIPKLDRVLACLYETLRIVPPITFVSKDVVQPTTLPFTNLKSSIRQVDQLPVLPGIMVDSGYFPLHYNPRYFKEPEVYNPDRFLAPDANQRVSWPLLEKAERRRFAEVEMINVLANLVLRYRFEPMPLLGENHEGTKARYMKTTDGLTLRPANVDVRFVRR